MGEKAGVVSGDPGYRDVVESRLRVAVEGVQLMERVDVELGGERASSVDGTVTLESTIY